ncbi:MAG: CDP-alcohol phosphatidyltransferase family protein [Deltaproteobacteria bacterium]|nr:CDP-alcohol phosphatidyltransferase family protein [Deltaproteobacteria bacterium]
MSTPGVNNPNQPTQPQVNGASGQTNTGDSGIIDEVVKYMVQIAEGGNIAENSAPAPQQQVLIEQTLGDAYLRTGLWDVIGENLEELAPDLTAELGRMLRGEPEAVKPTEGQTIQTKKRRFAREGQESDPWIIKNLANLFTGVNLVAGPTAVTFALNGEFYSSAISLAVGIGADRLDGFVARLTGHSSEKGAIFDDLADLGTFGISTGIVTSLATGMNLKWSLATVGAYSFAAMWRLGSFVSEPQRDGYFKGIPTTAASALITSALLAGDGKLPFDLPPLTGAAALLGLSVVMNSSAMYPKFAGFTRPTRKQLLGFMGLSTVGIIGFGFWNSAFAALSAYTVFYPVNTLYRRIANKPYPDPVPRPVKLIPKQAIEIARRAMELAQVAERTRNTNGHTGRNNGVIVVDAADLVDVRTAPAIEVTGQAVEGSGTATHQLRPGQIVDSRPGQSPRVERPGEQAVERPGSLIQEARPGAVEGPGGKVPVDIPKPHEIGRAGRPGGNTTGRPGSSPHR